jgi:hypothetical protein
VGSEPTPTADPPTKRIVSSTTATNVPTSEFLRFSKKAAGQSGFRPATSVENVTGARCRSGGASLRPKTVSLTSVRRHANLESQYQNTVSHMKRPKSRRPKSRRPKSRRPKSRRPGHEGTKCWYASTRDAAHDHRNPLVPRTEHIGSKEQIEQNVEATGAATPSDAVRAPSPGSGSSFDDRFSPMLDGSPPDAGSKLQRVIDLFNGGARGP